MSNKKMSKNQQDAIKRLDRLIRIIWMIQNRRSCTAKSLASEFKVSVRTIYRDIELLRDANLGLYCDETNNEYKFYSKVLLKQINFDLGEALAVITAMAEYDNDTDKNLGGEVVRKVLSVLPETIKDDVHKLEPLMKVKAPPRSTHNEDEKKYYDIQTSIRKQTTIIGYYRSAHLQKGQQIRIQPYSLVFHIRGWYVIGLDTKTGEFRILKLSRIKTLKTTKFHFERPESFSVEQFLGNSWGIVPDKERHDVVIRFSKKAADYVTDTLWHKTQVIEKQKNGGVVFRATVDGLKEIIWWVLSFGSTAIVEEPVELKNMVREELNIMMSNYT